MAVARLDTWRRHSQLVLQNAEANGPVPKMLQDYYKKLIPFTYTPGPLSVLGLVKKPLLAAVGLFRPVPRGPTTRGELLEVVSKTTALGCENLMLALTAQGFASCPMEGFDERRVQRILGLPRSARVVMVLGIGEAAPEGIYAPQYRVPRELVVHQV